MADGQARGTRRLGVPRGYALAGLVAAVVLVVLFVAVELTRPEILTDPSPWMDDGGPLAAVAGVGLLVADVLVPAPSSVVMTAHGALFGVPLGAALSLLGGTGATLVAFGLGRWGRHAVERRVRPEERARVAALLDRYGVLALVVTRPVPIVAEAVALLAGTTSMGWRAAVLGGVLGNVVPAVVYAVVGAQARSIAEQAVVLVLVLLLSLALWAVARGRTLPPAHRED
ncbi:TVP38/TMEM64 family protein [Motilibacter aurantiacus]|uniref:TVP38/TMEM64 family protein n=1 Tax=Motilibacter aurantiacus TaxID=2714955 RepID=UPI00140DEFEC|nr:VTT domain-containing protein [Motilibacter aurantiacus]NHC47554.1 TVP38/TMEM64 family protein [Motilibacter aurantiacus]